MARPGLLQLDCGSGCSSTCALLVLIGLMVLVARGCTGTFASVAVELVVEPTANWCPQRRQVCASLGNVVVHTGHIRVPIAA